MSGQCIEFVFWDVAINVQKTKRKIEKRSSPISFSIKHKFTFLTDCCDVALEHINCSSVGIGNYSLNTTCFYCPTTAIFSVASADTQNVTAFADSGNVTAFADPSNVTTPAQNGSTVFSTTFTPDVTTSEPVYLLYNETLIYNTTKNFVSPAQEYFLWVYQFTFSFQRKICRNVNALWLK